MHAERPWFCLLIQRKRNFNQDPVLVTGPNRPAVGEAENRADANPSGGNNAHCYSYKAEHLRILRGYRSHRSSRERSRCAG
jgi:hypothetical protein